MIKWTRENQTLGNSVENILNHIEMIYCVKWTTQTKILRKILTWPGIYNLFYSDRGGFLISV